MINPAKHAFRRPDQSEDERPMERGFSQTDFCGGDDCRKYIDRGVNNMCFNCTYYFCANHLETAYTKEGAIISIFVNEDVGESSQVCQQCKFTLEDNDNNQRTNQPDTEGPVL